MRPVLEIDQLWNEKEGRSLLAVAPQVTFAQHVVIKAGRLIDGTGGPDIENAIIVVEGDRIATIGGSSRVQVPRDARTVDLKTEHAQRAQE